MGMGCAADDDCTPDSTQFAEHVMADQSGPPCEWMHHDFDLGFEQGKAAGVARYEKALTELTALADNVSAGMGVSETWVAARIRSIIDTTQGETHD